MEQVSASSRPFTLRAYLSTTESKEGVDNPEKEMGANEREMQPNVILVSICQWKKDTITHSMITEKGIS